MLANKFKLGLGAALLAATLASNMAFAEEKFVAITAIVEHPALDSVRDGVIEALEKNGYTDGKNLELKYQSAQGNTGTAAQIARQFIGDKPDAIVAIATPSAQAVVAATKQIPVVYSAVVVKRLQELLPKEGMELIEASAPRSVDVGAAARSLIGKVDVIYTNTDNNVVSAYEALVKVGNEADIPLIASDTDSVKRGAIAALGINYKDLGIQTGEIVVRILKGENPGTIPSQTSSKLELYVNPAAAKNQGIELPEDLLKSAAVIVE